MTDQTYKLVLNNPGHYHFTMPSGFESTVQVYMWGAGGGASIDRTAGGAAGYAYGNLSVTAGDSITISVGGRGGDAVSPDRGGSAGTGLNDGRFAGGAAGNGNEYAEYDMDMGPGGGGGGATALLINNIAQCVAAGGGGAGGRGDDAGCRPGLNGGTYTSLTATTIGGSSTASPASGGGGGGGYLGGSAGGSVGDDGPPAGAGNGGQNYGDSYESGVTGTLSTAAKTTLSVPTIIGKSGAAGYAVLVFTRSTQLLVKESGDWKKINTIYHKTDTPVNTLVPTTRTFSTVGTTNFTVPSGVRSLNISYAIPGAVRTVAFAVTPGETLAINLGNFGASSSIVSATNTLTIPAYAKPVYRYVGNVDHITDVDVQVVTTNGVTLTTSGYNAAQIAAAAAAGITYDVTYEGWHGDLYSTAYFTTATTGEILGATQLVGSGGGRAGGPTINTQPSSTNGYIASVRVAYDPYGGEGSYDSTVTLQQQGAVIVNYNLPVPVQGWVEISKVWTKQGGVWRPLLSGNTITPDKL